MKTKEFSELSKLTLVMATYGRQEHAKRNMAYWSNTGVILLVLDASPKPIENEILKTFDDNIIYVHDTSDYNERLVNSFSKINTKYTQVICDDEFYPISAVLSCIKELEKDENIISSMGVCLGFDVDKISKKIFSNRTYVRLIENYNYTMNTDPTERILDYLKNYQPFLMYAMIRTVTWKKAYNLPLQFKRNQKNNVNIEKFNFFASDEIQINMYLAFAGRSKVIRELYWLRSYGEHLAIRDLYKKLPEPKITFQDWWNSNSEKDDYLKILEDSFRETKIKINVSYKEMALKSCEFFLKGGGGEFSKYQLHYLKDKKNFVSLFFFYLKRLLPSFFKDYVKSLGIWKDRRVLFKDDINFLINEGIKVNFNELNKIHKILENFHFK